MEFIDKFWNRHLAHHPLNWLILTVIVVMFCILLDSLLDATGSPKPVTEAKTGVPMPGRRRVKMGSRTANSQAGTKGDKRGGADNADGNVV